VYNGADSRRERVSATKERGWTSWLRLVLLGLLLSAIATLALELPLLPTERVVLEEGEVAPYDIRAPRSVTYDSTVLRLAAEEQAASQVEPEFTAPDPALARQQLDRARQVLDYLGSVRADNLALIEDQQGWITAVPELADLPADEVDLLLGLTDQSWETVRWETLEVVDRAMRAEIREDELEEARDEVPTLVSLELADDETAATVALARRLLKPNSFLDPVATEEARALAREQVGPVLRSFQEGEVIVREGARVTARDLEALEQLGLRKVRIEAQDVARAGLLATTATAVVFLYLGRLQPEVIWDGQRLLLLVLLTAVFVIITALMVHEGELLRYLTPVPALTILAAALLGRHAGVATAVYIAGLIGMVGDGSLELLSFAALGGLVGALTLGDVERIGSPFRAGAFAALAQVIAVLIFWLPDGAGDIAALLERSSASLAGAGISASLALGGLFAVGPLFDITTTMRLIELSRPDNPLLQRLLREAPATYHHSLLVANLAEQAAERIGADALLTRVGAYYHDVGKITRPYFFVENQAEGVNPHDRLDPRTSAEVIISHVSDGVEMARRNRLPRRVRAFIPEHHGTTWISFLYEKAVEQAGDPDLVNEDDFRHRGPKPQSKETALVMLADGCEAAVGATRPATADELAEVINRVIADRIEDGQLDECDLTLRDLDIVRESFISSLRGVRHPRIEYPDKNGQD
jgi:putative nucleotidyltransferase with HDIG domain